MTPGVGSNHAPPRRVIRAAMAGQAGARIAADPEGSPSSWRVAQARTRDPTPSMAFLTASESAASVASIVTRPVAGSASTPVYTGNRAQCRPDLGSTTVTGHCRDGDDRSTHVIPFRTSVDPIRVDHPSRGRTLPNVLLPPGVYVNTRGWMPAEGSPSGGVTVSPGYGRGDEFLRLGRPSAGVDGVGCPPGGQPCGANREEAVGAGACPRGPWPAAVSMGRACGGIEKCGANAGPGSSGRRRMFRRRGTRPASR